MRSSSESTKRKRSPRLRLLTVLVAVAALLAAYIVPTGVSAASVTVALSPGTQTVNTSQTATIQALVTAGGQPIGAGALVNWKVSGTNINSGTVSTNSDGIATISYQSSQTGRDSVTASTIVSGVSYSSSSVTVIWTSGVSTLSARPLSQNLTVNGQATITATATNQNGRPISGISVYFNVSGANSTSGSQTTGSNGTASFSYTGKNSGTDSVRVYSPSIPNGDTTVTVNWAAANAPAKVVLAPGNQTSTTGQPVSLTATVTNSSGGVVSGAAVKFTVTGANPSTTTVNTGTDGKATFTYTGNKAGTDTVVGSTGGLASGASTVTWIAGQASLAFNPTTGTGVVGKTITLTTTLTDATGNPVNGVSIYFNVTGANITSGSAKTDANGNASFTYTGLAAGTDTVSAYADINGNGTQNAGEPSTSIGVVWSGAQPSAPVLVIDPGTQNLTTGTNATVTAKLTTNQGPVAGINVYLTVTGINSASKTLKTAADGTASYTYTSSTIGADTIQAYADLNGNGKQDASEPTAKAVINWTQGTTPPTPPELAAAQPAQPKAGCTYFPETQHNLCAGFKAYWNTFGGLAVYGYPLTEEFQENGLTVQYFERERFEWHPGAWPQRFDVELGLLGDTVTAGRGNEPAFLPTSANTASGCTYFAATGHNLCGGFHQYWDKFGGLAVYGMPISEEFQEKNPDTGQVYTVQYFERARFEWHPGAWPQRFDVELGRLGAQVLQMKYGIH